MSTLPWLADDLAAWDEAGLRRRRRVYDPQPDGWCVVDGRRLRNFAGNDYLGLAGDPRVLEAAHAATIATGCGARGSPLVCGRTSWHVALEEELARFEGAERAILFPSGWAANLGTITTLARPQDVVFCDRWNHASLVDGCRLSGAKLRVYRHDDLASLERHLARVEPGSRRFLITDGVFSMDGDLAPLPELCELAERYDAVVIVDEAHATGVFGERGRGVCEELGVEARVAVRIGTMSKALGALGGFVTGSDALIETLWNSARSQMFSTGLPPAVAAAATMSLRLIQQEPERIRRLRTRCRWFRDALAAEGIAVYPGSVGPIVPLVIGEPGRTMELAARLESRGYLVGAIRPPTVPRGTSRLRISLTLEHDETALEEFAAVLGRALSGMT